jgi:hypothetical protein
MPFMALKTTPFNRLIDRVFRKSMRLRYAESLEGCEQIEGPQRSGHRVRTERTSRDFFVSVRD